jgi:hypothetical protein
MNTPFIFGKVAIAEHFTNRTTEVEKLVNNFSSLINTIIISPRRWGKSSLVLKAAEIAVNKNTKTKFCFIDMYNVRNEEQFYQMLAQEVLKSSSSKFEEMLDSSKNFLSRVVPKISISADSVNEISLSMDWAEIKKNPDEILDFAEKVASSKNIRIIVCIDEFQNISGFGEPLEFQKKLRSHWQKHQNVSYCLYGSKRHMLLDVFNSQSMPFYQFGDILFLEKMSEKHWIPFICERFKSTGKTISNDHAQLICTLANNHSFYVQQIAHLSWLNTKKTCKKEQITDAYESLLLQLGFLYQTNTDGLSNTQINFLEAALKETKELSSKETIKTYKLGTSANVSRIKQALINKEVVEINGNQVEFLDPLYKSWLIKHYFKLTQK